MDHRQLEHMMVNVRELLSTAVEAEKAGVDSKPLMAALLPWPQTSNVMSWLQKVVKGIIENADKIDELIVLVEKFLVWFPIFGCDKDCCPDEATAPAWPEALACCADEGYALRREFAIVEIDRN